MAASIMGYLGDIHPIDDLGGIVNWIVCIPRIHTLFNISVDIERPPEGKVVGKFGLSIVGWGE